ncbi:uncharacterized protein LOC135499856 isoform X1 [Lineus longissimus]|uniref:uncharacterized protein LOC135499856 isoform X1 n=1 Tax=Lineus longissimus TaxID=88925 RepID=UPI00315D5D47
MRVTLLCSPNMNDGTVSKKIGKKRTVGTASATDSQDQPTDDSGPPSSPISCSQKSVEDETTATSSCSSQDCEVEVFGGRKKKISPIKLPASASLWKDDTWWADGDVLMGSPLDLLRIKYDSEFIDNHIGADDEDDYKSIFEMANVKIDQDLEEKINKKQEEMTKWLPEKFNIENLDFEDTEKLKLSMSFLIYIMDKSNMDQQGYWIYHGCMAYLKRLKSIFEMCLAQPPAKPDEQTFTWLFCTFTQMLSIDLPSGGCMPRSLRVCGNDVKSIPDLRMLKVEDMKLKGCYEISVVTVGEVKKRTVSVVKDQEEQSDAAGDNLIKRRRLDKLKNTFSSDLRGQHAAELLVELPFSAVKGYNNDNLIFGLVIQATKVSLTCLRMKKEHLQELLEETSEVSPSHKANIFYTRPYDMLCAEDRKHLVYILTTLAKLAGHII